VREWEARAEALARKTEQEFRAQGLLDEINVVHLVGNHTANAWIEEFHGRQADCQTAMLPPRSGYWLGDPLAQRWLSQYSLRDGSHRLLQKLPYSPPIASTARIGVPVRRGTPRESMGRERRPVHHYRHGHLSRLRRKLGEPPVITTTPGMGYRIANPAT
jgi:hypothetical protein